MLTNYKMGCTKFNKYTSSEEKGAILKGICVDCGVGEIHVAGRQFKIIKKVEGNC